MGTVIMANERYYFLDWLRVIAIIVLVFFHTGMMFVGWGWHIENNVTALVLEMPMDIAHRLRMPLLFIIAGASLVFACKRRDRWQAVIERSQKLLLPLVIGIFVIVPPQIYIERIVNHQFDGGYLDFIVQRVLQFEPYPAGNFSWHHLWFIAYLFVYSLLLLPLLSTLKIVCANHAHPVWLYLFSLLLGLNEAFLKPLFPETLNLVQDWYLFNHYLLFTLIGIYLASNAALWQWLMTTRRQQLLSAALFTALIFVGEAFDLWQDDTNADAFLANGFTMLWLLTFIGYGKRYLSFDSPTLHYLRDASYPVYILHQTITVIVGYFVIANDWHWGYKYVLVLTVTFVISYALYHGVIRHVNALRIAFGLKSHTNTTIHAATPQSDRAARL